MKKADSVTPESLALLINSKVEELMQNPIISETISHINPSKVSETLIETLNNALNDEVEAEIRRTEKSIQKCGDSIEKRSDKLIQMKRRFRKQYANITDDTASLRRECAKMSEKSPKIAETVRKLDQKEKENVHKKEIALEQLLNIVDDSQSKQREINREMDELREFIDYFHKGTKKMMKQANAMCKKKLDEMSYQCKSNKQNMQSAIEASLLEQIEAEKEKQQELKSIADNILSTINSLSPIEKELKVDINSFEDNTDRIIKYIKKSMDVQGSNARKKIMNDIHEVYNDFQVQNDDPHYAVDLLVNQNMKDKEEEYNTLLKKRHERELTLKNQLKNALFKIQQLKSTINKSEDAENDFLSDMNNDDDKYWESTRKELDDKISELNRYKSESESSFINYK